MMVMCKICRNSLIAGDTWYPSDSKKDNKRCKDCVKNASREYARQNPSKVKVNNQRWIKKTGYKRPITLRVLSEDQLTRRRELNKIARKQYIERNPHAVSVGRRRRRQLQKNLTPSNFDRFEVNRLKLLAKKLEKVTGQKYEVDHIVPLSKGGLHHHLNMVVSRADFNCTKGNKVIPELINFFVNTQ